QVEDDVVRGTGQPDDDVVLRRRKDVSRRSDDRLVEARHARRCRRRRNRRPELGPEPRDEVDPADRRPRLAQRRDALDRRPRRHPGRDVELEIRVRRRADGEDPGLRRRHAALLETVFRPRPAYTHRRPPRVGRILPASIDKGVDKSCPRGAQYGQPGLSRLDRPTAMFGTWRGADDTPGGRPASDLRTRRRHLAVGVAAEVKNKLSVVDVVGETVSLKKAGSTYKGLCPFHGEKTPSFVVTPGRETWHCFGCGLGGDVFSFVMQRDAVSFPEALRTLAQKAGVEIDER